MNRRDFLIGTTLGASSLQLAASDTKELSTNESSIMSRPVPRTGEMIPCIGVGTSRTFDVGNNKVARSQLKYVLNALIQGGGSVVDSSPMYGSSESVVGDISRELNLRDKLFLATKVWTTGETAGLDQMETSAERMDAPTMDLMQVHNLLDTETQMKSMLALKEQGKIRYTGLSHYRADAHRDLESAMKKYSPDFIQINYSVIENEIEQRVLPLAKDLGIAVLINRPFMRGKLFSLTRGQALPDWASEFNCNSWGQVFLKYILANESVSCVIPGTSKVKHMQDNLAAGRGLLPSASHLSKIRKVIASY